MSNQFLGFFTPTSFVSHDCFIVDLVVPLPIWAMGFDFLFGHRATAKAFHIFVI